MGARIAVAGASGYAGGELLRLLANHPEVELTTLGAHTAVGQPVTAYHPHLTSFADRIFGETTVKALQDADLVFLALPHGESAALAAELPESVKIVDLGADHRLQNKEAWHKYYGDIPHASPWAYGLPELPGQKAKIAESTRTAGPGCYATAITVALAPLIKAGIADPEDIVVVASSGTTGAGRSLKPHLLASEVMNDLSPYRVGAHQHTPEILQATGAATLSFTPMLAPMPRGILATVTAKPTGETDAETLRFTLLRAYDDEPFVHILPQGQWPHTAATYGSNSVHLQSTIDADSGRLIVVSALDNLGKGAAGQAVQAANLMLGLPETTGLAVNGVAP